MTTELAETLQLVLLAISKNKTVYIEGEPGVGKTKLTEFLATLLGLDIHIFQMSANVELSDLIGGLELTYKDNIKRVVV